MAKSKDTKAEPLPAYSAEGDLYTLVEAAKIRKDKARLKGALALRQSKIKALENLDGKESA
jgi:hypothetical protein